MRTRVESPPTVLAQEGTTQPDPAPNPSPAIPSTRAARTWTRLVPAMAVLAVIVVFVFQNLRAARVGFLMFSGTIPLAAALLGAVALGVVATVALGSVRIIQLRKLLHRQGRPSGRNGL